MFRSRLWAVCLVLALVLAAIMGTVFQHQHLAHAASTLTVTTTADTAPPCKASAFSLRCAITQANTDGSGDSIVFNIPATTCGFPPCTIGLSKSLPVLTASHTTINGYTQPGAVPNSNALRNGDNAVLAILIKNPTLTPGFDALDISGSNNTIEGLEILGFLINLTTRAGGNALFIEPGSNNNLITGDFFEENTNGVVLAGNSNLIGGTTPASANLASASYSWDIEVEGNQNAVEGNLIGTNAAGTQAFGLGTGRGSDNILIVGSNTTIGGTTSGAGNVISGGTGPGVTIYGGDANAILDNLIGTNAADTAAIPNGTGSRATARGGVNITGPDATVSGNVISGNQGGGVFVEYPSAVLTANFIGVTATGQPLGNTGTGISISSFNPAISTGTIGGTSPGAGNTIAHNTFSGVTVGPASITSTYVTIRQKFDPWKFKIGQSVVDSQGQLLGKVRARFPHYILVERGGFLSKVYYVPQSAAKDEVKNNTIYLTMSEADLVRMGLNSVPNDLYEEGPEHGFPTVRGAAQFARRPLSPAETGHYNYGRRSPGINTDASGSYHREEVLPTPQDYVTEGVISTDKLIPPRSISPD